MIFSRRSFLATSAAALGFARAPLAAPTVLRAERISAQILPDGPPTAGMFGLNGSTPGPELRFKQGAMLDLRFENALDQGSALHWHGIRIDNAMDGVPGLTQDLAPPGGSFDYRFALPDAGTYWYHSHSRSWEQVERGLYGALIVEETDPPQVDQDITVILDDWRIERDGTLIENFGNMHDFAHAGRMGSFARVIPSVSEVRRGDRIRLRLINTATARVFPLQIEGIMGKIVALDGMPLQTPEAIGQILLAPAQRIDLIADVQDTVSFVFPTSQDPYPMGEIALKGTHPDPVQTPINALPQPRRAAPAKTPDHVLTLTMQGGAMGGRHAGDDIWSFNGVSGLPDQPWVRFERGQTARITLVNDTAFPHGIHLHGHHFHEIGSKGEIGPLRDTTLLMRGEEREILCVFDNPGKWLLHCHMLGHQASGMKTWVEVG